MTPATSVVFALALKSAGPANALPASNFEVAPRERVVLFAPSLSRHGVGAVSDGVQAVLCGCPPIQIAQRAVSWVTVAVKAMEARRSKPDKGFQDHQMDSTFDPSTVASAVLSNDGQVDVGITLGPNLRRKKLSGEELRVCGGDNRSVQRPTVALVANLVFALVAYHGEPHLMSLPVGTVQ